MTNAIQTNRANAALGVPALDHDAMMQRKYGDEIRSEGHTERRVVWMLIQHLLKAGFVPVSLYDGETLSRFTGSPIEGRGKSAMELIFNLDEASLRFAPIGKPTACHGVLIVLGNGIDCISDWNYSADDADGFNAAMSTFDSEQYA